jgi:prepilin-type N-terminal cleavage/methylation domain-containing protein
MRRRAFTLVELMTVVAILAILYAVLFPVFLQVKAYAQQYTAGQAMMKLGTATAMYVSDADEAMPVAYYPLPNGLRQNWFGIIDRKGEVEPQTSLLAPYTKGKIQVDAAFDAKPWQGDVTGFGYNWGYLGCDYYVAGGLSTNSKCEDPAQFSALGHPSDTIEFGTSIFYYAKWLPRGDGQNYRYGFVDPPKVWYGNPTLDFRHSGAKTVDKKKRQITSTGVALVLYVDGHLKTAQQGKVKNSLFERDGDLDDKAQN